MNEAQRRLLIGHRRESWRFEVQDYNGKPLGQMDGVEDGTFDYSIFDTIRSGGNLTYSGLQKYNWNKIMIQPWYKAWNYETEIEWPIGVFLPSSPSTKYTIEGQAVYELELYDKMQILVQDEIEETWSFDKGHNVVAAIKEVILTSGNHGISIDDSEETLSGPMVWEAGTTKLRIVNDLLESINYFSIWVDGYGIFHGDKYVEPLSRPLAWDFRDNEKGITAPEFTHDEDGFDVPNKVICIAQTDGEEPAMVANATNEDPNSPWSYQSRGRWISRTETGVEASSQAILQDITNRLLITSTQVTSSFEIQHAKIPLDMNALVNLQRRNTDIDVKAVVQKTSINTDLGSNMTTTIREVVS